MMAMIDSRHTPLLHTNGTPRDSLAAALEAVYLACGEAYDKTRECNPNMRDYYPLVDGQERFKLAQERVREWQSRLDAIRSEIEADIGEIDRQCR